MTHRVFCLLLAALLSSTAIGSDSNNDRGFASARTIPEWKDDFAFENDKVGFRLFGRSLRDSSNNIGIDCWFKRVDTPVIDLWYERMNNGQSYHSDYGEGYDAYHVGDSLGCGGLALWIDGQLTPSEEFNRHRVIENGPARAVFELEYNWKGLPMEVRELRTFTLKAGDHLFKAESQFFVDGKPSQVEVAIGLATHDGLAATYSGNTDRLWISTWETIDDTDHGTAVILSRPYKGKVTEIKSETPDRSHIIITAKTDPSGRIAYQAGFAWAVAGDFQTVNEWIRYVAKGAAR